MSGPPPINPYRHLASMVRANLRAEREHSLEDRARVEWMYVAQFCGQTLTAGKGGANTMFWQVNGGKRKFGYPVKLLELLDRLGRQRHLVYVHRPRHGEHRTFLSREGALRTEPEKGAVIEGCPLGGGQELVFRAQANLQGRYRWMSDGRTTV